MKIKHQGRMWGRVWGGLVCCALLAQCAAWGPALWAQEGSGRVQMLKNEIKAVGEMKLLDKPAKLKFLAVIRELDAKYSDWEEHNGDDFRKLLDESNKGSMSDTKRALELMGEYKKLQEEIKERISKELTPEQMTEFSAVVKALKLKEAAIASVPGMSPRQAVKALGVSKERVSILNALIAEYEGKVAEATKKRTEMMADGQKQMKSAFPGERARGAAAVEKAKKVTAPPVAELDAQITEALAPEFREGYKQLRINGAAEKGQLETAQFLFGRMTDGEFNAFCDAVFPLGDLSDTKEELSLRSKAVVDGLVTAVKGENYNYTRAMRKSLLELPAGIQIVGTSFPGLSQVQIGQIADEIRQGVAQFRKVPTDKEKREAFRVGFSKAVNVLTVEQRVWIVNQAEAK